MCSSGRDGPGLPAAGLGVWGRGIQDQEDGLQAGRGEERGDGLHLRWSGGPLLHHHEQGQSERGEDFNSI